MIVNRPVEFEENGNYIIVGVRHAGESYLLYQGVRQLQAAGKGWDEILFVDFEDERLAEFQTEDFEGPVRGPSVTVWKEAGSVSR